MSDTQQPAPATESAPKAETTTTTTTVQQKKGNKTLIIILVIVALLCLCFGIIAAGFYWFSTQAGNAVYDWNQSMLNRETNQDANNGTNGTNGTNGLNGSNTNDDGSTIDLGVNLPSNFPADVPLYDGATVNGSTSTNGETSVVLTVNDSAENIYAYYKTALGSEGWTIDSDTNYFSTYAITAKKGDRDLTVGVIGEDLGANDSASLVTLSYK